MNAMVQRETGDAALAAALTVALHGLAGWGIIVAAVAMRPPDEPEPEPPDLTWVNVTIKGELPDPKALPRLVKVAAPEAPAEPEIKLGPREEEPDPEAQKRAEEAKKRQEEEARKAEEHQRRKEAAERKRAMRRALARIDDRGDEDAPRGAPNGSDYGTTTDPGALQAKNLYAVRVSNALRQELQAPPVPLDVCKKLYTVVHFRVGKDFKVDGEPRMVRPSGNRFFDDAALRTVRRFGAGSQLHIPRPPPEERALTRYVLKAGITVKVKCSGG